MKIIKNAICLATLLTLYSVSVNARDGHEKKSVLDSMMIDGIWRTFEYHVPQHPAEKPRLVVVLHGNAMTTKSMQKVTGHEFNRLADKNGNTIIVYPQGYKNIWNHCRKEAPFEAKKKNLNDVVFIKSIVQRMERRHDIDRKNVFAVGYFNGGHMCLELAKSIPDFFRGFAVVGTNLPVNLNDGCAPSGNPISLLVINDTKDSLKPYEAGKATSADEFTRGEVKSTDKTLDYWLKLSAHTERTPRLSSLDTIEKDNSVRLRYDYYSKEMKKRISLLKIVKGGYPFPNPHFDRLPQMKGNIDKHINIPETVVRFFYQLQYSNTNHLCN